MPDQTSEPEIKPLQLTDSEARMIYVQATIKHPSLQIQLARAFHCAKTPQDKIAAIERVIETGE